MILPLPVDVQEEHLLTQSGPLEAPLLCTVVQGAKVQAHRGSTSDCWTRQSLLALRHVLVVEGFRTQGSPLAPAKAGLLVRPFIVAESSLTLRTTAAFTERRRCHVAYPHGLAEALGSAMWFAHMLALPQLACL